MKKFLALMLVVLMAVALAACTNKPGPNTPDTTKAPDQNQGGELAGTYDIKVWCADNIVELTKKQINDYNESNDQGIKFNATVESIGENDAATQMIVDVEAGGDIFCFAQDQFARLVQAGALAKLGPQAAEVVKNGNDAGAVAAATMGADMYAYPMTADNGYFMYYDKSVVSEEHLDSLEDILADCEAANKYFAMETNTSAWYIASFFFATGCKSEWVTDSDGNFTSVNDTFNSPEGIIAAKGLKKLLSSPSNLSSSDADAFKSGAAVVVSGTWAYNDVKNNLGDNMGATDLPSFTVDGQSYHMGSFMGYKLMGVKPQQDAKKGAALQLLAQYLTSEKGQLERFNEVAWGPSNLVALENEAVKANPAIAAVVAQGAYATPQGQIHGSWWNIAKVIGDDVNAAADDAGLQTALDNYKAKIDALFGLSGYIFVGAWNGWDNADMSMKLEGEGDVLTITLDVPESDYMGGRIVTAGTWDTDLGYAQVTEGADLLNAEAAGGDNNIVFNEAGNYTVTVDIAAKTITIVKN